MTVVSRTAPEASGTSGGGVAPIVEVPGVPAYPRPEVRGDAVPGAVEAFWRYEQALMADDVEAMAELFCPGPDTLRGDADGLLVSHQEITAFRSGRGGAPKRRVVELHVRDLGGDHASTAAVTEPLAGGRGLQTQVWRREESGRGDVWRCLTAHVSAAAPAMDRRVWRVVGDPLVPASGSGAGSEEVDDAGLLAGETVAVKDLFAVAGHRIGAGSPAWLEESPEQERSAEAVARLLDAGASLRGIAATDELAFSLAGTNAHYGTPPNPRASRRISGGSSSGSASAVSLGQASIGLGTDTGGSIRVPSAYQGLWGVRTSHGAVSRRGLVPLAPSFDTVGWMTRGPELLARVGRVLLPDACDGELSGPWAMVDGLEDLVDGTVLEACGAAVEVLAASAATAVGGRPGGEDPVRRLIPPRGELSRWSAAFRIVQGREAWQKHGHWVARRRARLAPDVAARFEQAEGITAAQEAGARQVLERARCEIRGWVGDGVLVVPSAAAPAPSRQEAAVGGETIEVQRRATMMLTCLVGLAGLPAVSVPLASADGLPVGLSLIGPPGADRRLLELAVRAAPVLEEAGLDVDAWTAGRGRHERGLR